MRGGASRRGVAGGPIERQWSRCCALPPGAVQRFWASRQQRGQLGPQRLLVGGVRLCSTRWPTLLALSAEGISTKSSVTGK